MSIIGGLDIHRGQLTFDYVEQETGRLERGRIAPADREHLAGWLSRFAGHAPVASAVEGCTGWRYVAEEMRAAGVTPHLAEPADTAALRGHLDRLRGRIVATARHVAGARALTEAIYGVGPMTSLALVAWLGGANRFSSSRKAVRFVGLDITVRSLRQQAQPRPAVPAGT